MSSLDIQTPRLLTLSSTTNRTAHFAARTEASKQPLKAVRPLKVVRPLKPVRPPPQPPRPKSTTTAINNMRCECFRITPLKNIRAHPSPCVMCLLPKLRHDRALVSQSAMAVRARAREEKRGREVEKKRKENWLSATYGPAGNRAGESGRVAEWRRVAENRRRIASKTMFVGATRCAANGRCRCAAAHGQDDHCSRGCREFVDLPPLPAGQRRLRRPLYCRE